MFSIKIVFVVSFLFVVLNCTKEMGLNWTPNNQLFGKWICVNDDPFYYMDNYILYFTDSSCTIEDSVDSSLFLKKVGIWHTLDSNIALRLFYLCERNTISNQESRKIYSESHFFGKFIVSDDTLIITEKYGKAYNYVKAE